MADEALSTALSSILHAASPAIAHRIQNVLTHLPIRTRELALMVFPDQDEQGSFSIRATLDGPDLYTLNRQITEWAELFTLSEATQMTLPAADSDLPGNYNDLLVDTVARCLQAIWNTLDTNTLLIPVLIAADEDYGTILPLHLHRPPHG